MNDLEFNSDLLDRIAKIQAIDKQYNLRQNAYIAFSGGKDSTVLSYLIDLALPNNNIPRVYANTGIEYVEMVKFVKSIAARDSRFIILNQNKNIIKLLKLMATLSRARSFHNYIILLKIGKRKI